MAPMAQGTQNPGQWICPPAISDVVTSFQGPSYQQLATTLAKDGYWHAKLVNGSQQEYFQSYQSVIIYLYMIHRCQQSTDRINSNPIAESYTVRSRELQFYSTWCYLIHNSTHTLFERPPT